MTKRFGMHDCMAWNRSGESVGLRGEVLDVRRLLALRDALRANEPAPLDAACWMADAIDNVIRSGGSLDKRLGLKRRGKPSVQRTAELSRRDALIRSLGGCFPAECLTRRAEAVLALLAHQMPAPDERAASLLILLDAFVNLPHSTRQVARILSSGN